MKKIFLYSLVISIVSLCACTREDYIKYDTSQQDAVYMNANEDSDSIFYNFGFIPVNDTTFRLLVRVQGMPRDYDRKINVRMINDKYASAKYIAAKPDYYSVPESFIVPKDSVVARLPVKLLRHKDLETTPAILTVELQESEDFLIRGHREYTITFDDKTSRIPAWWNNSAYMLGAFSKAKYLKFLEYFWVLEHKEPLIFNKIVKKYGRELNLKTSAWDNPYNDFSYTMKKNVSEPLYAYQEANKGVEGMFTDVAKPTY